MKKHFIIPLITFIILMIVTTSTLFSLWTYLVAYEDSRPETYIKSLIKTLQSDMPAAKKMLEYKDIELAGVNQFESYIKLKLGDELINIAYNEVAGKLANNELKYRLSVGDKKLNIILTEIPNAADFSLPRWKARLDTIEYKSYKIIAPSTVNVTVEGIELDDSYIDKRDVVIENYNTLKDKTLAPTMVTYKLDKLFTTPKVDITQDIKYDILTKDDTIMISIFPKLDINIEKTALNVAKTYAKYISRDAAFGAFSKYLLKSTTFYDAIKTFSNFWYLDHQGYGFENEKVSDIVFYSDKHFSADVSFNYYVIRDGKRHNFNSLYTISFVKVKNNWLVANFKTKLVE